MFSLAAFAVVPKTHCAGPVTGRIDIDGDLSEPAWAKAEIADGFIQLDPTEGAPASQQTQVRVLYDQTAIYISAYLFDTHPDSILHQLGNRDEGGELNSDAFRIGLDPYNKRQNAYVFEVSASGVQTELLDDDLTFDAVWESETRINSDGWAVEIRIPYSAIRFPAANVQVWAIQFARVIRRNREYDQWTLTPKSIQNKTLFWGTLEGIENVEPPLRLTLVPYLSVYGERSPNEPGTRNYSNSFSYSGGADIKYGIDERFTVDMTLLPDFSQVQSDNRIRNLSAFEVIYDERRPFFKEGTNLFNKGNLFYSRRIGRTPEGYYSVAGQLQEGETVESNPVSARLVNATKLSGRTDNGLGIGLFNAVTANTYAVIRQADGSRKKILTEPLSNYNLIILDQQLKNNCNIFLVNTDVMRNGRARDANVTTAQGTFENAKHEYRVTGRFSESRIHEWVKADEGRDTKRLKTGEQFSINVDKISGSSYYGAAYEQGNAGYDKNDMSFIFVRDYTFTNLYYSYTKFNPFWKHFRYGNANIYLNRDGRLSLNNMETKLSLGSNIFLLFNNNFSFYIEGNTQKRGKDFFQPRYEGRYQITPAMHTGLIYISTNYNNPVAFDANVRYTSAPEWNAESKGGMLITMVRFSDHLSLKLNNDYNLDTRDRGFVDLINDSSIYGRRSVSVLTNTLSGKYLFKNNMSLMLNLRHYLSNGKHDELYFIGNDGEFYYYKPSESKYDFTSSYFTVDLVYNWVFAPGSLFLISYKNQILTDGPYRPDNYFRTLNQTLSDPQLNSLSLKVLYFLDYEQVTHRRRMGHS